VISLSQAAVIEYGGIEALLYLVAGGPWKEAASQSLLLLTTLVHCNEGQIAICPRQTDNPFEHSITRICPTCSVQPSRRIVAAVLSLSCRHAEAAQRLCLAGGLAPVIACLKAGPNQSAAQHAAHLLRVSVVGT